MMTDTVQQEILILHIMRTIIVTDKEVYIIIVATKTTIAKRITTIMAVLIEVVARLIMGIKMSQTGVLIPSAIIQEGIRKITVMSSMLQVKIWVTEQMNTAFISMMKEIIPEIRIPGHHVIQEVVAEDLVQ